MTDTARLTGTPLDESDLPFLVEMYADDRVTAGIGGHRDAEQVRARLGRWMRHWAEHGWGGLMFRDRSTGERTGWGGLQQSRIGDDDVVTVGYVIRPDAWGQGYATEIADASVRYGFDVLGLTHLYASVDAGNAPSRRVLEKVGLTVQREVDHGDHVEAIYAVAALLVTARARGGRGRPARARARPRPT